MPAAFWRFSLPSLFSLLDFVCVCLFILFACCFCWYSVVGRIVDTLLTTFLDEFVGFLISLPLALVDSVHCSTLSDITHTPRWPCHQPDFFLGCSFGFVFFFLLYARFISVYSVVFVFNLAGCIDFAAAASFLYNFIVFRFFFPPFTYVFNFFCSGCLWFWVYRLKSYHFNNLKCYR